MANVNENYYVTYFMSIILLIGSCGLLFKFVIIRIIKLIMRIENTEDTTLIISLKPLTRLYGIGVKSNITLQHETNVIIRNGFTFKLSLDDNLYVGDNLYELGPIIKNNNDNFKLVKINPKSVTLQKDTPYSNGYFSCVTHNEEYYFPEKNTQFTLPKGTIVNNGAKLFELKRNTIAIIA